MSMRYEAPVPQDPPEHGRVLLRDGRVATLAPLKPADRPAVVNFFRRLSTESLAERFLATVSPEHAALADPLEFDPARSISLGVWAGAGANAHLVAIGSYWLESDHATAAEFALAVEDTLQGHGLGTALLERLALIAARAGIPRFCAYVHPGNLRMLEVLHQTGFRTNEKRDGNGIRVDFSVRPSRESVDRGDARDRTATIASLLPFFRPASVAVIGASRDPKSIGHRVLDNLIHCGFPGPIYPVNPKADMIAGLRCYPSPQALPELPDLGVVSVPAAIVPEAVDACGRAGLRAIVVISAGFAETGAVGRQRQQALVEQTRAYGMRMIGPNCLGILNTSPQMRLNASFAPMFPPAGRVAMSSQSGALGLALLDYARDQGIGVSSFVSVGNKADVSGNDLIQYWEEDPETDLTVLYLESFGNPRRFARLARRVGRTKPILVVKAGRSTAGSRAATSHTAALAASETAVQALFHQTGVIRADTLEELFDVAGLLARQPLPAGPRVAIVTNAGGPGILATDALSAAGLELPAPSPETVSKLGKILPPEASLANPIDMIASASASQYAQTLKAVLADPVYDAVLTIFIPVGGESPEAVHAAVEQAMNEGHAQGFTKPVAACFMEATAAPLPDLPVYRFPESAARALAHASFYAAWRSRAPGRLPDLPGIDVDRARATCGAAIQAGRTWLTMDECVDVLSAFRLPVVDTRVVRTADEAVIAADAVGYPVVVKIASTTLLHKTEWDGVKTSLIGGIEVRAACQAIIRRLEKAGKADALDGFVVQPMAAPGIELMAGSVADPLFGPLVAFGLGGIDVEDLGDVAFRITPLTDQDAQDMLASLRGAGRLTGTRGRPGVDRPKLVDLLLRVSRLVEELPEVAELDLNPIIAGAPGMGCRIVDVRIRLATPS